MSISAPPAISPPDCVIDVSGVTKCFGPLKAVDGVSFQIRRGQCVALLGANGAGKTTLIEMIEGLQQPNSGSITVLGRSWKEGRKEIYSRIGITFQETRFFEKQTAEEILHLFGSFHGLPRERTAEILAQIGLTEKRRTYTGQLSGGQRQRLAIGVALLHDPDLLLLDEPTTGLDPNARREVWRILLELKARGRTLVLTTHYMEEAQSLCDEILIMDCGRILAAGTLLELLRRHGCGEMIEFDTAPDLAASQLSELPGFRRHQAIPQSNSRLAKHRIITDDIAAAMPPLLHLLQCRGLPIQNLQCRKMTLDDLFVMLTGKALTEA